MEHWWLARVVTDFLLGSSFLAGGLLLRPPAPTRPWYQLRPSRGNCGVRVPRPPLEAMTGKRWHWIAIAGWQIGHSHGHHCPNRRHAALVSRPPSSPRPSVLTLLSCALPPFVAVGCHCSREPQACHSRGRLEQAVSTSFRQHRVSSMHRAQSSDPLYYNRHMHLPTIPPAWTHYRRPSTTGPKFAPNGWPVLCY
jgi:hypothetical protein